MSNIDSTSSDVPISSGDIATDLEAESFRLDPYLVSLMLHEPFFSSILRVFDKIKTDSIPTAGICVKDQGASLYWNPKFLASLESIRVRGLLKHECYHLIFKHCTARKHTPHLLWNWGTDLAINSLIPESELPELGLIPGKAFDLTQIKDKEKLKKWEKVSKLIASLPKCKAAEWYFAKLQEDKDIKETIENAQDSDVIFTDDHDAWGDMSDEDRQIVEGKIKKILADAVKKCDSSGHWGSVGSSVQSQLREMVSNEVPWDSLLRNFVG